MLLLGIASCGQGSGTSVSSLDPGTKLSEEAAGLPGLEALPEPSRQSSISGPGWYQVPILEQGVLVARGMDGTTAFLEEGISVSAEGGMNYLVFGIGGFDGDNRPTSLMTEFDSLDGEYYIGVSRYADSRWEVSGPHGSGQEVEYIHVDQFSDASQHISSDGYHYVAIMVPDGSSMVLSGLQLGVDGGDEAPQAPPYFESSNGAVAIVLYWEQSPDHNDPDFAGYVVERALWPGSDYEDLGPLDKDQFFSDETSVIGTKYRYRLRVEDVSGNSSHSTSSTQVRFKGDNRPIPVLDIPAGPLYGAQMVNFDMSGSFDPDDDAIDQYIISFGDASLDPGIPMVMTTDDQVDIMLQPGCYEIRLDVQANGLGGYNFWKIKVYPQWQNQPVMVAEPTPVEWRIQAPRSTYFPLTGEVVTFFDDLTAPGLGLLVEDEDERRAFHRLPYASEDLRWISEPVVWNDRVYAAVLDVNTVYMVYYDGSGFHYEAGFFANSSFGMVDLVVDGNDRLQICVLDEFNPGDWRIVAVDASTFGQELEIMDLSNSDGWFDVEWNDSTETFDTVYTSVGSIHWERRDIEGNLVDDSFLAAGIFDFMDLEIDSADGTPGLLALLGGSDYNYYEYDNTGMTWSVGEVIDNSGFNDLWADFIFVDSDPTVFFGMVAGQASLYRRNGGSWDKTTSDWAPISGDHCSLTARPDGSIRIIDGAISGDNYILTMQPDDSHGPVTELSATSYEGRELVATWGVDGFHAYWRGDAGGRHFIGTGNAEIWNEAANMGPADAVDLMADRDGIVFLSHTSGGGSQLFQWVGGAWVIESAWNRWGQHMPFVASQNNAPGGQWLVHDNTVAPSQLRYMHDDNGVAIVPDFYAMPSPQVMEGTMLWTPNGIVTAVSVSDFGQEEGRFGFLSEDDKSYNQVFDGDYSLLADDWVRGRSMEGANFSLSSNWTNAAIWTASRPGGGTGFGRVTGANHNNDFSITDVSPSASLDYEFGNSTNLSTVTAGQGWGITAIGLVDRFFGNGATMEWSNFGEFEELDLPPLDMRNTSMHELAIGPDGRWHVFYRDMTDGAIYVISTT